MTTAGGVYILSRLTLFQNSLKVLQVYQRKKPSNLRKRSLTHDTALLFQFLSNLWITLYFLFILFIGASVSVADSMQSIKKKGLMILH